ncbi:MAG: prepilin-type N-terminal cleavage/methylation domain-containing protein [bacterium]|nr:prepilin-type N-terminal cleavage/methylation domain-containing protein [bacterium]
MIRIYENLLKAKGHKLKARCGFTLIEVMVVVAILVVVFGYTIGAGSNFYTNQALISERDSLVSLLRGARSKSLVNINQLSHGVLINTSTNQYIVFDGASYAARNQAYDIVFPKSSAVAIAGPSEIVFSALEGASNTSDTIVISSGVGVANIVINSEGRVSW